MTNAPVKNLSRYLSSFIGTPHLVFLKPTGHHSDFDSTQPTINVRPAGPYKSLASYPVDGEYIIFGFEKWTDAARFALDNGTEVFESDPEEARRVRRALDIAQAIWDVRTNTPYDLRNGREPRTVDGILAKKGLPPACDEEMAVATAHVNRVWPSTPF